MRRVGHLFIALVAALLWPGSQALAQCIPIGTNQTCTNFSFMGFGIIDLATLTLTNTSSGIITGNGVLTFAASNVSNAGIILSTSVSGIAANTDANVNNSGMISGAGLGVSANNTATVINSGTISATHFGRQYRDGR